MLSELEYNTKNGEEIQGIYDEQDYLQIQPKGKYIIINDLDFSKESSEEYSFGNNSLILKVTLIIMAK